MATLETLNKEITAGTTRLNELRLQGADAPVLEEAKKKLGELKKSLAMLKGAGSSMDAGKKKERLLLKTAKARTIKFLIACSSS